jgi:hypothetical protein
MSGKSSKRIRRAVMKEAGRIKVQGLEKFLAYSSQQGLYRRIVFAIRVVFKRVKVK